MWGMPQESLSSISGVVIVSSYNLPQGMIPQVNSEGAGTIANVWVALGGPQSVAS